MLDENALTVATPPVRPAGGPSIGLALGAGGARGFSHIAVLDVFDELGIRPALIAGSSMGAIIGAGYAAGMSGREIREYVLDLADNRARVLNMFWGLRPASIRALGGSQTLRGFKANRFLGRTVAFTNVELRHRFADFDIAGQNVTLTAAPFFDAGSVGNRPFLVAAAVRAAGGVALEPPRNTI